MSKGARGRPLSREWQANRGRVSVSDNGVTSDSCMRLCRQKIDTVVYGRVWSAFRFSVDCPDY